VKELGLIMMIGVVVLAFGILLLGIKDDTKQKQDATIIDLGIWRLTK